MGVALISCNKDSDGIEGGGKGNYHNDDKEGLRMFLHQGSTVTRKQNAELLGLDLSDISDWYKNESWVEKITGLTWNDELPKRLFKIDWSLKNLTGSLDASKWTRLEVLDCYSNRITSFDFNSNKVLKDLTCIGNQITTLDVILISYSQGLHYL